MVVARNENSYFAPVKFYLPRMYADGCWAVNIVFGSILQPEDVRIFIPFLEGVGCLYFISEINGNMAIFVH